MLRVGVSSARFGTRLTLPPMPLPPGATPLRKALGPLNSSTRSRASVVMICRGSTPYRPLKAMSSVCSGKPRMVNTWEKLPKPADWRTDESLSSTSPRVRAC
ncbi:hypothetical protein D3C81_1633700 [compost metagenome]